jgi:hypothetical protein
MSMSAVSSKEVRSYLVDYFSSLEAFQQRMAEKAIQQQRWKDLAKS